MEEFAEKQYGSEQRQREATQPASNTIYLQVNSEQVKGLLGSRYAVPTGFVGVVEEKSGRTRVLMPGEEAGGEFTVHLVRDRDVRIPYSQLKGLTRDGFDASLSLELALSPDVTRRDALERMIERASQGRQHMDWPLLKGELQPRLAAVVKRVLQGYEAAALADPATVQRIRAEILQSTQEQLHALGIGESSVELGKLHSDGHERHVQQIAETSQKAEKARAEQEIQTAILRDQLGQELSRSELEDFVNSAREQGLIKEHERRKADLSRQTELDRIEAEYRQQQHNLEATLRKLVLENKLELDTLLLEKHIGVVKKLKDELSDDRLEVYINLIQDEKLKAELLERLIQRQMSAEQLSALAEIEAQRARQIELGISRPRLEPVRDVPTGEKDSDSVRMQSDEAVRRESVPIEEDAATRAAHEMNDALGTALSEVIHEATRPTDAREREVPTEPLEAAPAETQKEEDTTPEVDALLLVASGRRVYAIDPLRQRGLADAALDLGFDTGRLGSLRSVRVAGEGEDRVVLAGARNGVYATLLAHRRAAREFPIGTAVDARTGINAMALYRGYLYATHSEYGLLRWPYLQPYSPAVQVMPELISQFSTTRSLQVFGNRLLFANGPSVLLLEAANDTGSQLRVAARYRGTRHEVTALATDDEYVLIADAAGDVYVWNPEQSDPPVLAFFAGTPVSDLAAAELKGSRRALLVAIKRSVMPMLFRDGSTALEFNAPEAIRNCDVMNGIVVGLGRDRMRVFAWHDNRPDWPAWQFQFTEPVLDARLIAPGTVAGHNHGNGPRGNGLKRPPGY